MPVAIRPSRQLRAPQFRPGAAHSLSVMTRKAAAVPRALKGALAAYWTVGS